jgi:serine/threonine protein phosphatase PrpC
MNFGEKLIHDPEHSVNRTHQECIYLAAVQLDEDLHMEVLDPDCDQMMVQAAISGAVACFAHIIQNHLYVGNIGDSAAVLVMV